MGKTAVRKQSPKKQIKLTGRISAESIQRLLDLGYLPILVPKTK